MIKDLTNFVRSFVYGEPPFPVCADSLYILKHILPEQIFVIVFAICVVGAFIGRPPWWNILFSHICFDVINVVYRICTHCVQTVCNAHGLPLQYNNCFAAFIKFNLLWKFWRYLRASDERPTVWFVQTIKMLRSGIKVFGWKNYLNIESHARAFLVFYCTNYLHEWGAEALGYWLLEEIGLLFKLYNFKYAYF